MGLSEFLDDKKLILCPTLNRQRHLGPRFPSQLEEGILGGKLIEGRAVNGDDLVPLPQTGGPHLPVSSPASSGILQ